MDDAEKTIYHEAGHCVMAVVCGARVERATVDPEEDGFYGLVEIHWPKSSLIEDLISVALSGPVAEMIYCGEPFHPGFVPEWSHDWKQAWRIASKLVPGERERLRFLERVIAKLHQTFSRDPWWAAVSAVSDLLDAHDEIEHEDIAYEVENWIEV